MNNLAALSSLSVLGDENQDGSNDGNNDGNKDGNDEGNQTNSSNDNPPPPPQAQPFSFDFRQPAAAPDVAADDVEFANQNEFLALLPPSLLPKLEKLKSLHLAREELMEEYRSERAKLEARFHARMKPLYEERKKVVVGEMDEEFRKEKNEDKENDEKEKDENEKEKEMAVDEAEKEAKDEEEFVKGIPQFWACAMGHFDVISELVTEGEFGSILAEFPLENE